eukprot:GAFH01000734.1.p1 GENE.GAFH01000734.1~~GAFH01000734.1.p1  ORF type:complete len:742 (+),score=303.03 GAFH01000734.1:248-2227(+)
MKYDGEPIELNIEAEEIATYYAMCFERAPFKRQVFQDNFFADFRKALTPELRRQITDLTLCDFKPINDWWKASVAAKKAMPKEEKKKILEANKVLCAPYQFCMVDGHKQKVSNFRVEPPTLFQGRGEHPLAGKLKKRIRPEDVTINIGEEATVPKAPEGHRWAEVIHNHDVTWLAMWKDEIMNHHKYVMLAANSTFRGQSDFLKFEAARCLHSHIGNIRATYQKDMVSRSEFRRQRGTALCIIDTLAIRVGNEKDKDAEADTVGCCTLRVENFELREGNRIKLSFLGKDSVLYDRVVPVPAQVWENFKLFQDFSESRDSIERGDKPRKKKPSDKVFDRLQPQDINDFLHTYMDGISAKTFRTYNASLTLQKELQQDPGDLSEADLLLWYKRANTNVAILCNHQRALPKTFDASIKKLRQKYEYMLEERREVVAQLKKHKKTVPPSILDFLDEAGYSVEGYHKKLLGADGKPLSMDGEDAAHLNLTDLVASTASASATSTASATATTSPRDDDDDEEEEKKKKPARKAAPRKKPAKKAPKRKAAKDEDDDDESESSSSTSSSSSSSSDDDDDDEDEAEEKKDKKKPADASALVDPSATGDDDDDDSKPLAALKKTPPPPPSPGQHCHPRPQDPRRCPGRHRRGRPKTRHACRRQGSQGCR